jgi:hypothetical protein
MLVACGTSPRKGADAGEPDSGMPDAGSGSFTCSAILLCLQACTSGDVSCQMDCIHEGTPHAQQLYGVATSCVQTACPQTAGGVCADTTSSGCTTCQNTAETSTCAQQLNACTSDNGVMPGGPDGGTSCEGIINCIDGCTATTTCDQNCLSQGTAATQQLYLALNNCLTGACPQSGACATSTSSGCVMCLSMAQSAGGTCYSQLLSCQGG